jgi:hypothetical protein
MAQPEGTFGTTRSAVVSGTVKPAFFSRSEVPMAIRPHDMADLYLAPVALAVDSRIEDLGRLDKDQLEHKVAFQSDSQDYTPQLREQALIAAITSMINCHDWAFSWDSRGLRLTHEGHTFVLGVPTGFREYMDGSPRT